MASEEDVPPLEDMSELIKQVNVLRELKDKSSQGSQKLQNGHGDVRLESSTKKVNIQPAVNGTSSENKSVQKVSEIKTSGSSASESKPSSTFGGMKKGFLFGGAPKKTVSKVKPSEGTSKQDSMNRKTLEEIPFVRKNEGAKEEQLRFSEVQDAMAKTNEKLMQNKEWVTDDLLNKLEKNEKLAKRLQDPTFIQAIGEFQKNPTAALQKYGNNQEVQEFFTEFCGLMGEHFNKMADQQSDTKVTQTLSPTVKVTEGGAELQVRSSTDPKQATAADEAKMQEILSNPETRQVLMDPQIQDLFQQLRNDPEKGQRILQTASGDLRQKIHILVQAGILQFQRS